MANTSSLRLGQCGSQSMDFMFKTVDHMCDEKRLEIKDDSRRFCNAMEVDEKV